jgi:hypothetical protein
MTSYWATFVLYGANEAMTLMEVVPFLVVRDDEHVEGASGGLFSQLAGQPAGPGLARIWTRRNV